MEREQGRVIVAFYQETSSADEMLERLEAMQREGRIELIDAAVITRELASGQVHVGHGAARSPKKGLGRGAIAGAIVGVIFPPSILVSAVLGAGVGGVIQRLAREKIDKGFVQDVAGGLQPGSSALVAIAGEAAAPTVLAALNDYERVTEQALDAETLAGLTASESPE